MQIGGIGNQHNSSSHHVTECMHTHAVQKKGSVATGANGTNTTVTQSESILSAQPEASFSLSAWLDKTRTGLKNLWGKIWGSSEGMLSTGNGNMSQGTTESAMAEVTEDMPEAEEMLGTAQIAAVAAAIAHPQASENPPDFVAVENFEKQRETVGQRARVKFKEVASQLMGQLPGRFAGFFAGSSFQTKQEQPRQELRRQGKARENGVDFENMPENDSHLMDSYDSTGNYRKLGEEVQSNISVRK